MAAHKPGEQHRLKHKLKIIENFWINAAFNQLSLNKKYLFTLMFMAKEVVVCNQTTI